MPDKYYYKNERYFLPEHWTIKRYSYLEADYLNYLSVIKEYISDNFEKGARILDLGCGDGRIAYELQNLGFEVTGLDYSERAIGFAKLLAPKCQFYCVDLTKEEEYIQFNDKFDLVINIENIEHIDPKFHDQILRYAYRCLKNKGTFIITMPSIIMPRDDIKHYKHFTLDEAVTLVENNGFLYKEGFGVHKYNNFLNLLYLNRSLSKLIQNKYYDLICLKRLRERIYNCFFSRPSLEKAGRFILVSTVNKEEYS